MSRAKIEAAFPRLKRTSYFITSPESVDYSCIAWAVGDDARWWWPDPLRIYYWPAGIERREDMTLFLEAFASIGYQTTAGPDQEAEFEKIAIFTDANGKPTHAARQLANGAWTSKLGEHEDIRHTIYGLEGSTYGDIVHYLKRPTSPAPLPKS